MTMVVPSFGDRNTRVTPMVPPAPPTFSTITGWPSDAFMCSATMRATMSVMPPAGNGTMSVTGFDGNDCACTAKALPSIAPSATRKHSSRDFMRFSRTGEASMTRASAPRKAAGRALFSLDAVGPDDRPPLVELALMIGVQRLRRQLRRLRNAHAERRDTLLHRRIGERLDHRVVELGDNVLRRALRRPQTVPERDVHSGDADLLHGRHFGQAGVALSPHHRVGLHLASGDMRQGLRRLG